MLHHYPWVAHTAPLPILQLIARPRARRHDRSGLLIAVGDAS